MNTTIEKVNDLAELSLFLSKMNKQRQSHIGYCGEKVEEIKRTLEEDFIASDGEIRFIIARSDEGEIIAAIGLDIDGTTAEVWGPFNQSLSIELQDELWRKLVTEHPAVENYYFFINKANIMQQNFMKNWKSAASINSTFSYQACFLIGV